MGSLKNKITEYDTSLFYKIKKGEGEIFISYDKYDDGMIVLFINPDIKRKEIMLTDILDNAYIIVDQLTKKVIGLYFYDFDYNIRNLEGYFEELRELWIKHKISSEFCQWVSISPQPFDNEVIIYDKKSVFRKEIPRRLEPALI